VAEGGKYYYVHLKMGKRRYR